MSDHPDVSTARRRGRFRAAGFADAVVRGRLLGGGLPIVADTHAHTPGQSPLERRRHARFLAGGRVVGTLVASNRPVRIRDVSAGGFSIETVEPLPTGGTEPVRLTAHDDWSAVVQATSLYCRPTASASGLPMFVAGYAFVETDESRRAVATLLEKITSVEFGES